MLKKILLALAFTLSVSASLAELPAEVQDLVGKQGKYVDLYNGGETRLSGGHCTVKLSPYDSTGMSIVIEAPITYPSRADLEGAKKSIAGNGAIVFKTTEHGRRPGGSSCGDFVPMNGYVKTVEIKDNAIVIRQKYRCGFFEKNDIMSVCDLN